MIFGFLGGLRREELVNVHITHIREEGSTLFISIPDTKTHKPKSFATVNDFVGIVKKYAALRPEKCPTTRFFLNYQDGKCTVQPIGVNKIGGMPKIIAEYLRLPNPETFTGHTFHRTGATLLVNAGADITTLKMFGKWKSTAVAEGYIADSSSNKQKIAEKISSSVILKESNSKLNANNNDLQNCTNNIDCGPTTSKCSKLSSQTEKCQSLRDSQITNVNHFHNCVINLVQK